MSERKTSTRRSATTTSTGTSAKAASKKSPAAKKKPASASASSARKPATGAKKPAVTAGAAARRAKVSTRELENELGVSLPESAKKAGRPSKAPPPPEPSGIEKRKAASRQLALRIAEAALDKKAERIEIVDVSDKVDYADFLVLMTGRSDRQVVAVAQSIEEALRQMGRRAHSSEGLPQGQWVLLDFSDVVVHIFLEEARKYYDLEGLWSDAPRVPLPVALAQAAAASTARMPSP